MSEWITLPAHEEKIFIESVLELMSGIADYLNEHVVLPGDRCAFFKKAQAPFAKRAEETRVLSEFQMASRFLVQVHASELLDIDPTPLDPHKVHKNGWADMYSYTCWQALGRDRSERRVAFVRCLRQPLPGEGWAYVCHMVHEFSKSMFGCSQKQVSIVEY